MSLKTRMAVPTVSTWLLSLLTFLPANAQVGLSSCSGIGTPASKADIVNLAATESIPNTGGQVEAAFEEFALASVNVPPNTKPYYSDARRVYTNNKFKNVVPDGVSTLYLTLVTNGTPVLSSYAESVFWDSKAVNGRISLSVENYQALGFIDALTNSLAGEARTLPINVRPTPRLIYLTTSDTIIGSSTTGDATTEGVAIFQQVACIIPSGGKGVNYLRMGRGILLNPIVYTNRPQPVLNPLPPGNPGKL